MSISIKTVILAAGSNSRMDINSPKTLLPLGEETFLSRILSETKVLSTSYEIIVGEHNKVFFENYNYKVNTNNTGSLSSLQCTALDSDYYLIFDSDIVFEKNKLKEYLSKMDEFVLVTPIQDSSDNVYVESKYGFLSKISKNRQTLDFTNSNQVFVGIVLLSKKSMGIIKKCLGEHWEEDGLTKLATYIDIPILNVDLNWKEADTKEDYKFVLGNLALFD